MPKYNSILTLKIENCGKNVTKEIILEGFDSFEEAKDWQEWLKSVYKKVKKNPNKYKTRV